MTFQLRLTQATCSPSLSLFPSLSPVSLSLSLGHSLSIAVDDFEKLPIKGTAKSSKSRCIWHQHQNQHSLVQLHGPCAKNNELFRFSVPRLFSSLPLNWNLMNYTPNCPLTIVVVNGKLFCCGSLLIAPIVASPCICQSSYSPSLSLSLSIYDSWSLSVQIFKEHYEPFPSVLA